MTWEYQHKVIDMGDLARDGGSFEDELNKYGDWDIFSVAFHPTGVAAVTMKRQSSAPSAFVSSDRPSAFVVSEFAREVLKPART